jgi:uncharacterized Fe-S radical SAM superfamily protein PflX
MARYHRAGRTGEFEGIGRRLYREEFDHALAVPDGLGLRRLDQRSRRAAPRLEGTPA